MKVKIYWTVKHEAIISMDEVSDDMDKAIEKAYEQDPKQTELYRTIDRILPLGDLENVYSQPHKGRISAA